MYRYFSNNLQINRDTDRFGMIIREREREREREIEREREREIER
jgi:hypothetical protein